MRTPGSVVQGQETLRVLCNGSPGNLCTPKTMRPTKDWSKMNRRSSRRSCLCPDSCIGPLVSKHSWICAHCLC